MQDPRYKNFSHGNRDISYTFEPAQKADAPLVVILHGHTRTPTASKFRHEDWNVLCPVDNFGYEGWGSWFLGEGGDLFWLEAMPELIRHVYSGDKYYFCGSSMGGYGSILHGCRMRARGVYANIPQTRLLGSTYSNSGMKKFFEPIFKCGDMSPYNDLRNVLEKHLPTSFILSGLRWDKPKYIEEQTFPFLAALCENEVNFRSEIHFGAGHKLTYTTVESLALLAQHFDEIEENYARKMRLMKRRLGEGPVRGAG